MAPAKNIYLHMCRECGEYRYEDQPCYVCEEKKRRMSGAKTVDHFVGVNKMMEGSK